MVQLISCFDFKIFALITLSCTFQSVQKLSGSYLSKILKLGNIEMPQIKKTGCSIKEVGFLSQHSHIGTQLSLT